MALFLWLSLFVSLLLAIDCNAANYTNEWAVEVTGGIEVANELARKYGLWNRGKIGNLDSHYHFILLGGISVSLPNITNALNSETHVGYVEQQLSFERVKRSYYPPTDSKWNQQWSLKNTGQTKGRSGLDLNVERAWIQGVTGKGVVVGVVDDGLQWTHPDIRPNYESSISYDFLHYDNDPTPDPAGYDEEPNSHGTSTTGEIAMVRNSLCGIGVAYQCKVGGLKMLGSSISDAIEASALGHKYTAIDIYSNSWGPNDKGYVVSGPKILAQQTLKYGAKYGRNGKGSIYVFASGNGGWNHDSCAADGYVNSIYTIGIGSANQNGFQASYDENCTAKMAVTYSFNSDTFPSSDDDWDAYKQVVTTSLNSKCIDGFTGTSASAPLVSGTVALMLEVNPSLSWRDIQYLIAYTSNHKNLHGIWTVNGGGLYVSSQFGFGAIDAEAIVTRARTWTNVPSQLHTSISGSHGYTQIYYPYTTTFTVNSYSTNIRFLEHVVLNVSLTLENYGTEYYYDDLTYHNYDMYDFLTESHPRRGDIQVELTSPHGTKSVLLPYRKFDFVNYVGYSNWPFMSVHHWGESPLGTWKLKVLFKSSSGYVTVRVNRLELYGVSTTPVSVSNIPKNCDSKCTDRCSAEHCDSCANVRNVTTLECMDKCDDTTNSYNGYCVQPFSTHRPPSSNDPSSGPSLAAIIIPTAVGALVFIILAGLFAIIAGFWNYNKRNSRQSSGYRRVNVTPVNI